MFPPPPYFSERDVRPWLLERAIERLQKLNRPDASDDEIVDSIMLQERSGARPGRGGGGLHWYASSAAVSSRCTTTNDPSSVPPMETGISLPRRAAAAVGVSRDSLRTKPETPRG